MVSLYGLKSKVVISHPKISRGDRSNHTRLPFSLKFAGVCRSRAAVRLSLFLCQTRVSSLLHVAKQAIIQNVSGRD